ncbi:MAG: hypothetical protein JXB15_10160 [Anaerolineales bacterium]|nr:hypothetical protein [Anaerolineales bacterium]
MQISAGIQAQANGFLRQKAIWLLLTRSSQGFIVSIRLCSAVKSCLDSS